MSVRTHTIPPSLGLDDEARATGPLFESFPIWKCDGCGVLRDGVDVGASLGEGLRAVSTGKHSKDTRPRCNTCGRPIPKKEPKQ